jgi:anti-anti-sigma factor
MSKGSDQRSDELRDLDTLRVDSVREGDRQLVVLAGTLDVANYHELEAVLDGAEASDAQLIVIDLRKLDFADSSGVRAIVMAHRRWGSRLAIVKAKPDVQRVFDVQGMAQVLPFVDDLDGPGPAPNEPQRES